jgi:hypothetical protein
MVIGNLVEQRILLSPKLPMGLTKTEFKLEQVQTQVSE